MSSARGSKEDGGPENQIKYFDDIRVDDRTYRKPYLDANRQPTGRYKIVKFVLLKPSSGKICILEVDDDYTKSSGHTSGYVDDESSADINTAWQEIERRGWERVESG